MTLACDEERKRERSSSWEEGAAAGILACALTVLEVVPSNGKSEKSLAQSCYKSTC